MPLRPVGPLSGTNNFVGVAIQQVMNLLTGRMTDQPITIANSLTVRSNASTSSGGGAVAVQIGTALVGIYTGSAAPTITAPLGSWYFRTDGSSAGNRAYINTNSSAAWTGLLTNS